MIMFFLTLQVSLNLFSLDSIQQADTLLYSTDFFDNEKQYVEVSLAEKKQVQWEKFELSGNLKQHEFLWKSSRNHKLFPFLHFQPQRAFLEGGTLYEASPKGLFYLADSLSLGAGMGYQNKRVKLQTRVYTQTPESHSLFRISPQIQTPIAHLNLDYWGSSKDIEAIGLSMHLFQFEYEAAWLKANQQWQNLFALQWKSQTWQLNQDLYLSQRKFVHPFYQISPTQNKQNKKIFRYRMRLDESYEFYHLQHKFEWRQLERETTRFRWSEEIYLESRKTQLGLASHLSFQNLPSYKLGPLITRKYSSWFWRFTTLWDLATPEFKQKSTLFIDCQLQQSLRLKSELSYRENAHSKSWHWNTGIQQTLLTHLKQELKFKTEHYTHQPFQSIVIQWSLRGDYF